MAATEPEAAIVSRTRPVTVGAGVVATHFLGPKAMFVLAEEAVVMALPDGGEQRHAMHAGGILSSAADATRVVTGGDDGKIVAVDAAGQTTTIARDGKRRWIDAVAVGPDGAVGWSAGKTVFVRTQKGDERSLDVPSSVGGLAFTPRGFRLAVAHYNGASLWFPNAAAAPEFLEWKGSHLGAIISPDGKYLVTTMQEPMLHGWRLVDRKHMRMAGYAAKVRSLAWTAGGNWLATSGAEQLVLWPFHGKDGPMGKAPRMLAPYRERVALVACHPVRDVVAVGYEDGLVLMVRIEDGAEIIAKRPGGSPVTALAFDAAGALLAFGTEAGEAGVVDLS